MVVQYEGYWLWALMRSVFAPMSGRVTIVINPKSACSSLKFNVWRQEHAMGASPWAPPARGGGIHRKENTPLPKSSVEDLEATLFDKPVFSIVRNPYTRILSAYLDKISRGTRPKRQLLLGMGCLEEKTVPFSEFVDFLYRQNSRELNAHYAPQAFLMQVHYVPYVKIGCVENMDESISGIMAAGYDIAPANKPDFRPHRTNAGAQLAQYYTDEIAEKVFERFRVDFEVFGYSRELSKADLPAKNLDDAARLGQAAAESFLRPALRAAVAKEKGNYATALDLLSPIKADEPELDSIRAGLLIHLKRDAEALPIMQRVLERVDNVGQYWLLLGESLAHLKRRKEAIAAAERAVAVAPFGDVLRGATRICKIAGDKQRTLAYRERSAAIDAWPLLDDEGNEIGKRHKNRVAKHHRTKLLSFGGF